jgi:hypothetical protein
MGRPKLYKNDAEKQAAYRQRKGGVTGGLTPLESYLQKALLEIQKEIDRQRKEADVKRGQRVWNPENTMKLELLRIVDYVQSELDRLGKRILPPPGTAPIK